MPGPHGGVIATLAPSGIGAEIGLQRGDILISINGHALRDVIDYRFHGADENLVLVVEREGERHTLEVERDYDEELGIEFVEPTFDGMRLCDNRCPFCFVQQMPRGLRRTLYLRDDDYRYSFLLGNFVTLTNLTNEDWARIADQNLSPLYVSIHASDPAVRRRVLGNPDAPDVMAQLGRLRDMGITVHGQIVIWPGVNDGSVFQQTITDLSSLWPTLRTLAIVPVGLTRYHDHPAGVHLVDADGAKALIHTALEWASACRSKWGHTWLYPSDELFVLAGHPFPAQSFYDDDAQRENGVGMVRMLRRDWERTRRRASQVRARIHQVTWACGMLIAPLLRDLASEFTAHTRTQVRVAPVANRLLGPTVTVSGLLAGQDLLSALADSDPGEKVFIPRAMLDASGQVTLDDMTIHDLESNLGVPVVPVSLLSQVLKEIA